MKKLGGLIGTLLPPVTSHIGKRTAGRAPVLAGDSDRGSRMAIGAHPMRTIHGRV